MNNPASRLAPVRRERRPDPLPPGPLTVASAARSMGQNAKLVLIIGGAIVGGVLVLALLPSFAVLLIRLF